MTQKRKSVDVDEIGAVAMCVSGCGFFGNAATMGMCSKCYRAATEDDATAAAEKMQAAVPKTSVFAPEAHAAPPEKKAKTSCAADTFVSSPDRVDAATAPELSPATAAGEQPGPAKPATNRCLTCRKKVGLTGFRCCCGGTFCGVHRYAEVHACGFDYKRAGRVQIAKNNPLVVAAKIGKI